MASKLEEFNQAQIEAALPRLRKVASYVDLGLGPTEIGKLLGLDRRLAWKLIKRCGELGLLRAEVERLRQERG